MPSIHTVHHHRNMNDARGLGGQSDFQYVEYGGRYHHKYTLLLGNDPIRRISINQFRPCRYSMFTPWLFYYRDIYIYIYIYTANCPIAMATKCPSIRLLLGWQLLWCHSGTFILPLRSSVPPAVHNHQPAR
jgi:hypothetical protein